MWFEKKHQLKHSDFRQFCCGSCGKYYKCKQSVVSHFNRCSVKLGYVNFFARQDWDREQTICGQLLVWQLKLLLLTQDLSVYSVNYWLYTVLWTLSQYHSCVCVCVLKDLMLCHCFTGVWSVCSYCSWSNSVASALHKFFHQREICNKQAVR